MKTKLTLLASLLLAAGSLVAADRIEIGQLPPAVKKTLDASTNGDAVKQITVQHMNGRSVYDVELERKNALNPRLRIAEDGQLLRDTTATDAANVPVVYPEAGVPVMPVVPKLSLSDVPGPVQQTIKKEATGREIATIERGIWNGQASYRVTFRERGRNPEFYVANNGSLLKPVEKPPGLASMFMGTQFEDAPAAVQETIRRQVGDGEIVKIDKERRGDNTGYKVDIKDTRGTYQIRVSENGEILENTRATERPANRG
jgi:uncharacterized membrane protein YkoI